MMEFCRYYCYYYYYCNKEFQEEDYRYDEAFRHVYCSYCKTIYIILRNVYIQVIRSINIEIDDTNTEIHLL